MNTPNQLKLKPGDTIRVVAPSQSLSIISQETQNIATKRLQDLGFRVTFGLYVSEVDDFNSSSIESRVADLHAAFSDPEVNGVFTVIGGFNCNQLLRYLDWDLIRKHPKVFCGYSDTTALSNAMLTKSGLITYSGPSYSSFGEKLGFEYTMEYFQKAVMQEGEVNVESSKEWSDDAWYKDQEKRQFIPNAGTYTVQKGGAEGRIIGGNLCTFNLLQGTEYMPDLAGSILFVEDDDESTVVNFDRDLQSLIHQPGFEGVRGMVIGRFQKKMKMTPELLQKIISSKRELSGMPVIAGADFGHTSPQFTYPIGGRVRIAADAQPRLVIS